MENKKDTAAKLKDKISDILFDVITDVPESLYEKSENKDEKIKKLITQASLKASAVSATLSVPAGLTGILTSVPDIVAVWKIQSQLVADIAATYGKLALLSREAMVWCLFRHSAASLLRDVAVRTGSRLVVQTLSTAALKAVLQKIGIAISAKFAGKALLRAIPAIGAIGNGAYTYYDTTEVGKTADAYFKGVSDQAPEVKDADIVTDTPSDEEK